MHKTRLASCHLALACTFLIKKGHQTCFAAGCSYCFNALTAQSSTLENNHSAHLTVKKEASAAELLHRMLLRVLGTVHIKRVRKAKTILYVNKLSPELGTLSEAPIVFGLECSSKFAQVCADVLDQC